MDEYAIILPIEFAFEVLDEAMKQFPSLSIADKKPWKGGVAYRIKGNLSDALLLSRYLLLCQNENSQTG